jgi:hypothetical protein
MEVPVMNPGDNIPDYIKDYITRSSLAMEQIAQIIERQDKWISVQWPQLVDTLNSDFLLHNQKTENLENVIKNNLCEAINAQTEEAKNFRTEVWSRMWKLFERVTVVAVAVIAAIAGWRIITGGAP